MHIAFYICHIHRNLDIECYTQNHFHIDISLLRMAHSRLLQPLCRSYVTQENSQKFHTQPKSLISCQKAVVPSAIESSALYRQGPHPRADRPCIQPRVLQRHQQGKMIPPVVLTFRCAFSMSERQPIPQRIACQAEMRIPLVHFPADPGLG
jgi:hypothetical protein